MTDYAHILAGWTQADLTACGGHTPGHTPYDVALADQVVLVGDPADVIRRAISTIRDDAADDASEAA